MCEQTFHGTEKPLRYDRMSGLDSEQLDELVFRIEKQLDGPWDKGIGRPRSVTLREAVIIASGYMRQNIIQYGSRTSPSGLGDLGMTGAPDAVRRPHGRDPAGQELCILGGRPARP